MPNCTFIHAADLHLGAPFRGLDAAASAAFPSGSSATSSALSPALPSGGRGKGNLLAEAGFEALARLETACLETGADFLILSGDVYDDKDGVLRARFALRDMFLRLREAGVRVFFAHGNHDPLRPGPLPVAWPDNVTVFGADVSCECVMRDGVPIALVHGVSHTGPRETENLSLRFARYVPGAADDSGRFAAFPPDIPGDIFQIAVLHCAVGGAGEGHAPYAPCSLADLTGAGFDYWALGHVHQGGIMSETPFVVYPGSLQGLHINETGPHGCCVVRVTGEGCSVERLPLASVVWKKIRVRPDGETETLDALEERILDVLDETAGDAVHTLFCRVILEGETELDSLLRRPGNVATLLARLRAERAAGPGPARVWLKDIVVGTAPVRDLAALAERDDLAGEVVRMARAMREDRSLAEDPATDLVRKAVAPLYANARLKKALAGPGADADAPPGTDGADAGAALLADEAASLLCSLLEGGE